MECLRQQQHQGVTLVRFLKAVPDLWDLLENVIPHTSVWNVLQRKEAGKLLCNVYFSICSLALMHSCVRGPQDHPQVQWCTRRAHRTQFIVAFMTMINYSEMWHKAKSAKGKGAWGRDQRKPGIRVQESSLCVESQRTNFSPFPHGTVITQANCCQPGKLIGYSLLQVDTGSRLHRYSLSSQ